MTEIADIPIDPGEHPLVVSAPNHLPFQTTVRVAEGERREIAVPALRTGATSRKTLGKILAVSGGVFVGTSVVLGFVANRRYEAQFAGDPPNCDTNHECNVEGQTATERARTIGIIGSVVGGVGLAATAVGVYLWIRSPKDARDKRVSVVPHWAPGETGVVAVGRF